MAETQLDDLAVRTRFLGLDAEACKLLTNFWPVIEPAMASIIEDFYRNVTAVPHLKQMLGEQIPRLKQTQFAHWQQLFSGRFDQAYFVVREQSGSDCPARVLLVF